jgi:phage shock protein C
MDNGTTSHSEGAHKLMLSATDKKILGVCGGLAEYFRIDPTLVRVGWIIITALSGFIPGIIAYVVAAVIIPAPARD